MDIVTRPFVRRYPNFSNRIGQMDFSTFINLFQMIIKLY